MFSGVLRRRDRPHFSFGAPNDNQWRSAVDSGTSLKVLVKAVRDRVPPLLLSRGFQVKRGA